MDDYLYFYLYLLSYEEIYPWYHKINNIIKAIIFVFKNDGLLYE